MSSTISECLPVSEYLTPRNINQYDKTKFIVILHYTPVMMWFATSVSLPSLSLNKIVLQTSGLPIKAPSNNLDIDDLSIEFIVDEDFKNYFEVVNWISRLADKSSDGADWAYFRQENVDTKSNKKTNPGFGGGLVDISVITLTSKRKPNIQFFFKDCWVNSVPSLELRMNDDDTDPAMMSCNFTVTDMYATNLKTGERIL
jgi:hypothetical protein